MYRQKHFEIFLCLRQPQFPLSWSINLLMVTGMCSPCPRCNVMYESQRRVSSVKPRQQHFPGALSISMQFPGLICSFAEEHDVSFLRIKWVHRSEPTSHFSLTRILRKAECEWRSEDLLLEEVLLVEEEDDGGVAEPLVVAYRVEQLQRLLHAILKQKQSNLMQSLPGLFHLR